MKTALFLLALALTAITGCKETTAPAPINKSVSLILDTNKWDYLFDQQFYYDTTLEKTGTITINAVYYNGYRLPFETDTYSYIFTQQATNRLAVFIYNKHRAVLETSAIDKPFQVDYTYTK